MRKWLVYGLPAALLLGACGGDEGPPDGDFVTTPPPQCANGFVDPTQIGVGGDLSCVDPNADTDMDGVKDVNEGTGDADLDGIPDHLDPDSVTVLPEGGVGNPDAGGPTVIIPTSTEYVQDDTASSGLPQGTLDELKAAADGATGCDFDLLYPYDGTVFPAGLVSPRIMWPGNSEGSYIHMTYENSPVLDLRWASGASNPGEMRLPQEHWNQVVSRTQNQNLVVRMAVKSGGAARGCLQRWRVAPGQMIGSVYYNTYNSADENGLGTGGGAVMRIRLGQNQAERYQWSQPTVAVTGPCRSCHSVSANGSVLISSEHAYLPFGGAGFGTDSYQLGDTPNPQPTAQIENAEFAALTPDGTKAFGMGNPDCTGGADTFPRSANNFPLVEGPEVARMFDTSNGEILQSSGLNPDWFMWMPQFAPDGDKMVYNHARMEGGSANRFSLAWSTFDYDSNAFGAPQVLIPDGRTLNNASSAADYAPDSGSPGGLVFTTAGVGGCTGNAGRGNIPGGIYDKPAYPSWPFFTPDGNGVVFALNDHPDFASAMPGRTTPAKSELWYVDLRDGAYVRLDNANKGLAPTDALENYFPTVLPVQVGGYFWVFWTSTREWGHNDMFAGVPLSAGFDEAYFEAPRKRIWVTALRPRYAADEFGLPELTDMSSPGFYLEGQSASGNVRAFAALNPCLQDGSECTTGLDCCSGYCDIEEGAASGTCTPEPPECADINEKCEESTDCCQPPEGSGEPSRVCLGGYCGFVAIL